MVVGIHQASVSDVTSMRQGKRKNGGEGAEDLSKITGIILAMQNASKNTAIVIKKACAKYTSLTFSPSSPGGPATPGGPMKPWKTEKSQITTLP